jgi:hypothetical protein
LRPSNERGSSMVVSNEYLQSGVESATKKNTMYESEF